MGQGITDDGADRTMMRPSKLALAVLLFAISACDQAPDDDPRPATSVHSAGRNKIGERSSAARTPKHRLAHGTPYELQGVPGRPPSFASQEKCETARTELIEARVKEARELSRAGPLPLRPPELVCFPL